MVKSTLFFIMIFMMCLPAGARSAYRSHAEFVHLPDYKKDQFIIQTMKLVVELENRYQKEVKKYGFNQDRYERYKKLMTLVSSLFIDSAYAQSRLESGNWDALAMSFTNLMGEDETATDGDRCIFGGWVSSTYTVGARTYCRHPSRSEGGIAAAYPDAVTGTSCSRNDGSQIQCNPVIFGYKNKDQGSLFCVSTTDTAKNSSFHCMQKALSEELESPTDDPPAERLGFLRDKLSNDSSTFNNVQMFVYRTCICDTTHTNFNGTYHGLIREHRTCYGLMKMVGETVCSLPDTTIFPESQHSIFTNLKNTITTQDETALDGEYTSFIATQQNTPEYNRICRMPEEEEPVAKNYICESVTCSPPVAGPATAASADGETVTSEGEAAAAEGEAAAAGSEVAVQAPALTCQYVVKEEGGNGENVTFAVAPTEIPETGATTLAINFEVVAGQPKSATCNSINIETPREYQCTATCVGAAPATSTSDGNSTATASGDGAATVAPVTGTDASAGEAGATAPTYTCNSFEVKRGEEVVQFTSATPESKTVTTEETVTIEFNIGEETKSLDCSVTKREAEADEEDEEDLPTFELTKTAVGETAFKLTVTPSENAEGWTVEWRIEKPEGFTGEIAENWKSENPEIVPGLATEGEDEAEAQGENSGANTSTPANVKEITQPRLSADYKVYAKLVKEGKPDIPEQNKTIEKLATASAAQTPTTGGNMGGGFNPNQGLPPVQIRGTSDTSAIGIR